MNTSENMKLFSVEPKNSLKKIFLIFLGALLVYGGAWRVMHFLLYGDLFNAHSAMRELVFLSFVGAPIIVPFLLLLPFALLRKPGTGVFCETGIYLRGFWSTKRFLWPDVGTAYYRQKKIDANEYDIRIFNKNREAVLRGQGKFPPEHFVPSDCCFSGPFTLEEAKEVCAVANEFRNAFGIGPSNKVHEKEAGDKYYWSKKSGYKGLIYFGYAFLYPVVMTLVYLLLNRIYANEGGIPYLILEFRGLVSTVL